MQLFAIVATVNKNGVSPNARAIVENFLKQHLNKKQINAYLDLFEEFLEKHSRKRKSDKGARKRNSVNSVKVLMICHEINETLQQKEKFVVVFHLLEFVHEDSHAEQKEMEFIDTVADVFNISSLEYLYAKSLVFNQIYDLDKKDNILIVNSLKDEEFYRDIKDKENYFKHFEREGIDNEIFIVQFPSIASYFVKYTGHLELFLNGHLLHSGHTQIFDAGSIIKSSFFNPIYQSDVMGHFLHSDNKQKLTLNTYDLEFHFPNSENGLYPFNFSAESGQLVGIMGGSGVGKSTLLNILNGNLQPQKGKITINGLDLHKDRDLVKGAIGFVPQDDLLIEELTVFQNLYYNAKLCFSQFSEEKIIEAVNETLENLDLYEIKDLKVGDPLNKFISGGQRKRLNIALELIREPSILYVDEPTSGLSSMDSEIVMLLLKELAIKGKLVVINIHQPSSDIYKLFDKILIMDKGGRPIYNGNPLDAVVYFKTHSHHLKPDEAECHVCGNVNPELVLEIVEAKVVNEYGKFTKQRKVSPEEWYQLYKNNIESKLTRSETKTDLPENHFKIPSILNQFKVFSIRNLLSKLSNKQYILINFFEAPLLAAILAFFTKYIKGTIDNPHAYLFSQNENMPAYLFMSVLVALFIGLTVSAEEIIKEQRILKREAFLNLSRFAFLNSKVLYLFALSAFQTFSFVLVGNLILEINGLYWEYFFILFTTSAFANMVGLNISSALNSVVTIYILIPFILVPQILLSGTVVNFDKLHRSLTSELYVPLVGDLMTSRWAYEALAVTQFKDNPYEKNFFEVEKKISYANFRASFIIPKLESLITQLGKKETKNKATEFKLLQKETTKLYNELNGKAPKFKYIDKLNEKDFTTEIGEELREYLLKFKKFYQKQQSKYTTQKDKIYAQLIKKLGSKNALVKFKMDNHNENISNIVLNVNSIEKIKEKDGQLIQKKDPVFFEPYVNYGRAQFYASEKKIGNLHIGTFAFNNIVIWLTSLVLYFMLLDNTLRKILEAKIWKKRR